MLNVRIVISQIQLLIVSRGQRSEVRGQRSEDKDQRSEVRGQKAEDKDQRSESRGQRADIHSTNKEISYMKLLPDR